MIARDSGATLSFDPGSFQMIDEMGVRQFLAVTHDLGIDILLPNKEEGSVLTGGLSDPDDIVIALAELYPQSLVMLKLDADGASFSTRASPPMFRRRRTTWSTPRVRAIRSRVASSPTTCSTAMPSRRHGSRR